MTLEQKFNALKFKIAKNSTQMLKDIAKQLYNDGSDSAGLVLGIVVNELEERMSEEEFFLFLKTIGYESE